MRIDRFISNNSAYSRKDVRKLINQRRVCIDGIQVVTSSQSVTVNSIVQVDGEILRERGERYFMLNKPAGYISASADGHHKLAMDLLAEQDCSDLHIAGRLDIDTTGLLLVTSDGQWSHRVTSPNKQVGKCYRVTTADPVNEGYVEQFAAGVYLRYDDLTTRPAQFIVTGSHQGLLTIHEGRYHQVKRMFAAVGNRVVGLHRESIGLLALDDDLASGHYRSLTAAEVALF